MCVMFNFPCYVSPGFLSPVLASGHHTNKSTEDIAKQIRKLNRLGQRSKWDSL